MSRATRPVTTLPGATEPTVRCTDKRFVYTPAANTDIRKTFERVHQAQEKDNVQPLKRSR